MAVLSVAIVAIKVTLSLGVDRKLPNDYWQVERVNSSLQTEIDEINKVPVLPKLEVSWRSANASAVMYGIDFKPLDEMAKGEQMNSYSGPLRNWTAQLSGDPRAVMGVAKKIQSEVPTFLYDYTISGGIMKLNITVVGT